MRTVDVWREHETRFDRVGRIDVFPDPMQPPLFRYDGEFLARSDAAAISASLPLREGHFDEQVTDAFFDGLLSEGDLRSRVASALGFDSSDTTELLAALNYDTIGALVFTGGEPPSYDGAGFASLSSDDITALADDTARRLVPYARRAHVSLPGFMNKIGVVRKDDGGWALPLGLAPSTWILKFGDPSLGDDIANEALCLMTTRMLGLPAARFKVLCPEGRAAAICVERFDRVAAPSGQQVAGRLHQEDFCQALGFGAGLKYDRGYSYFSRATNLIRRMSARPAADLDMFLDNIFIDYLVGNCDNHLKNYSLAYAADWKSCRLSPAYDKLCTARYPQYSDSMGIPLTRKADRLSLGWESVAECLDEAGYPLRLARNRFARLARDFDGALEESLRELHDGGVPVPGEVADAVRRCADEARTRLA